MSRHDWKLVDGKPEYFELGGEPGGIQHGGPYCQTCDEYFCQHEPSFDWNSECPGPDAPFPAAATATH